MRLSEIIGELNEGEFLKFRLLSAGIPRPFQLSREGLELSEKEFEYLQEMASDNKLFSEIWSRNIRHYVFPLFMLLRKEGEGLAKVERLYKLMLLLACIT